MSRQLTREAADLVAANAALLPQLRDKRHSSLSDSQILGATHNLMGLTVRHVTSG
jgi:hypothetical protein